MSGTAGLPQYQGEVPQEDVSEKADVQPPQASAPPMDGLQMAGYETATFQGILNCYEAQFAVLHYYIICVCLCCVAQFLVFV